MSVHLHIGDNRHYCRNFLSGVDDDNTTTTDAKHQPMHREFLADEYQHLQCVLANTAMPRWHSA